MIDYVVSRQKAEFELYLLDLLRTLEDAAGFQASWNLWLAPNRRNNAALTQKPNCINFLNWE